MENFFAQPINIGNLKLKNRIFLAPLAGVSDIPFRRICQEFGAGLTYVEMLSANAVNYVNAKTLRMRARHPSEEILGVQVTGPTPEDLAKAVERLDQENFDTIDINMGCPVKKVVKANCGSAITKDTEYMAEVVAAVRAVTSKPLSTKFRIGFDRVNVEDSSLCSVKNNVEMFTIHGRTAQQSYADPVDFSKIADGIHAGKNYKSDVVTVGNGDIFDYASALRMREQTGCDAIMISRGSLGNPWIFREILEGKPVHPTLEEWLDVILRQLQYHEEHYGDNVPTTRMARKYFVWYAKGFPGCKAFRNQLQTVDSLKEARKLFKGFATTLPKTLVRYQGLSFRESQHIKHGYDPKYDMDRKLDRGVGTECME